MVWGSCPVLGTQCEGQAVGQCGAQANSKLHLGMIRLSFFLSFLAVLNTPTVTTSLIKTSFNLGIHMHIGAIVEVSEKCMYVILR